MFLSAVTSLSVLFGLNGLVSKGSEVIFIIGFLLSLFGLIYESVADFQLYQFKKNNPHKRLYGIGLYKFSRPELMGTLYSDDPGTFSREDSLLSFGFLLKEGRLKKLPGGQFEAVPDLDDAQNHQRVG